MTLLAVRATHLLFMGLWVGSVMWLGGDVRRSVDAGGEHRALLADRVLRALRFMHICAGVTIASGFALVLELGGFANVPLPIHVGMGFAGLLAMLGGGALHGAWHGVLDRWTAGEMEATYRAVRRLGATASVFKTGWLVVFVLMVFRNHIL